MLAQVSVENNGPSPLLGRATYDGEPGITFDLLLLSFELGIRPLFRTSKNEERLARRLIASQMLHTALSVKKAFGKVGNRYRVTDGRDLLSIVFEKKKVILFDPLVKSGFGCEPELRVNLVALST